LNPDQPSSFERWQQAEHAARAAESTLYQATLEHARGAPGDRLDELRADAARKRERARQLLARSRVASLDAPGRSGAGCDGPR
jgi:hypothetical protein